MCADGHIDGITVAANEPNRCLDRVYIGSASDGFGLFSTLYDVLFFVFISRYLLCVVGKNSEWYFSNVLLLFNRIYIGGWGSGCTPAEREHGINVDGKLWQIMWGFGSIAMLWLWEQMRVDCSLKYKRTLFLIENRSSIQIAELHRCN